MEDNETYRRPPELLAPNADWKIFLTCKRGKSHVAADKVCQDYCVAENITGDIFVVAAADGHGGDSYVKSDVGSRLACETVVELAKKYSALGDLNFSAKLTSPEFKRELFDTWQSAVLEDYRAENPATSDNDAEIIKKYGTTLLFAAVTKSHVILGQVGDGAILLFNDENQSQLFTRHNPKFDSKTSSLASSRGIYSLHVESYRRVGLKFNNILLSTDGIYDRLDRGDSFALYAGELAAQIRNSPPEKILPFTVTDIDVSEKSSDDCTIAAVISPPSNDRYEISLPTAAQIPDDFKFERAYNRMEIFSTQRDGVTLELHVSDGLYREEYFFGELSGKVHLLKPAQSNFRTHIFALPKNFFRLQELIEHGEHLERRYISREDEEPRFTNEFWLEFYETIRTLKKIFAREKYFAKENLFKTMLLSADGEIFLFADCLSQKPFLQFESFKAFQTLESYFGFLGKIRCGEKILPLFRCRKYSPGQIVPELHGAGGNFCRVVYNPKVNSYGLQNLSDKIWLTDGKQVKPNQVLKIARDRVLKLLGAENTVYEIELFATE